MINLSNMTVSEERDFKSDAYPEMTLQLLEAPQRQPLQAHIMLLGGIGVDSSMPCQGSWL
jgi:hypothetical protein